MTFYKRLSMTGLGILLYFFLVGLYLVLTDGTWSAWVLFAGILIVLLYAGYSYWKYHQKKENLLSGMLKTVHRFSFLIEQLVSRDFKTKYKRSVLGVFWSFLNPLLMMLVQYAVFSKLMGIRNLEGANPNPMLDYYAVYLLIGIIMYNGFNDCCNQAMRSIVYNASLITKVYVPKVIYPTTKVFSASLNLILAVIPLYLIVFANGLWPNVSILLLPMGILFLIVFVLGMGYLLSSLVVFFRDIEFLWGVVSTMWMYATPIIYDIGILPEIVQKLMVCNPLHHFIDFVRTIIILRQVPGAGQFMICTLFSVGMLALGLLVFRKTEDKFIFYI